jgi:hypothetical protein
MPTSTTSSIQDFGKTAPMAYLPNLVALEVLSILISAAFIIAIVVIIVKTGWLSSRVDRMRHVVLKADMPKRRVESAWKKTQTHFFAGDDNDLKIAIMQADNLLEDALRSAGVRGTNLGDRLKNLKKGEMPNLEQIWQAHKLRNQIAHEADFTIKRDLAERTLGIYGEALQNLGVLGEKKENGEGRT